MKCFCICKVMKFYKSTKFFCAYLCKIMIKSKLVLVATREVYDCFLRIYL